MSTILDLFIQDFVTTNRLLGQHWAWESLSSRRLMEAGPTVKVFEFTSGGTQHLAIGRWLALPECDWFRIELGHPSVNVSETTIDHRFDCLRMMHKHTHDSLSIETNTDTAIVKLTTRHRGLINLVFVLRTELPVTNPFLI
jgi:hypothetical protein